jgi:hypothetical protein
MAKIDVNISVADEDQDRFAETVKSLRAAGLEDVKQYDSIRTVSGSIDSAKLPDLQQVEGVVVEEGQVVSVPNPDEPDQ